MLKIESDLRDAIKNRLDDDEKIRLCMYVFDSLEAYSKKIISDYTKLKHKV